MDDSFPRNWMWSQACEMLARAERMHREMFRPLKPAAQLPVWEPPLDMLETEAEVPGIDEKKFLDAAEAAKKNCPVSQALAGTEIKLNAKFVKSAVA